MYAASIHPYHMDHRLWAHLAQLPANLLKDGLLCLVCLGDGVVPVFGGGGAGAGAKGGQEQGQRCTGRPTGRQIRCRRTGRRAGGEQGQRRPGAGRQGQSSRQVGRGRDGRAGGWAGGRAGRHIDMCVHHTDGIG